MKKCRSIFLLTIAFILFNSHISSAQCSICTRSVQQMGQKPAKGINGGIIYLAAAPFLIFAVIGYKWWKSNRGS